VNDEEYMRKKKREHAFRHAGETAALWGGLAGATGQLINGNRSVPSILLRGLGTAAVTGPAVAEGEALGHAVLGDPKDNDPTGYSVRGAVGGGLGGAALGGGVGYLLGSGRLRGLASLPYAGKIAQTAKEFLPLDNIITDRLRKWAAKPSHTNGLKAAALLGLGGGATAGLHGFYEGMDLDFLNNLKHQQEVQDDQS
jgi:hypothetical protein